MVTVQPVTKEKLETEHWQECRKKAALLNIPAWQLAENGYKHRELDKRDNNW